MPYPVGVKNAGMPAPPARILSASVPWNRIKSIKQYCSATDGCNMYNDVFLSEKDIQRSIFKSICIVGVTHNASECMFAKAVPKQLFVYGIQLILNILKTLATSVLASFAQSYEQTFVQ